MLLGPILLAITLVGIWFFRHPAIWFPAAITQAALLYDQQFRWTLEIVGILFISAQLTLAWIIIRKPGTRRATTGLRLSPNWVAVFAMVGVEVALAAHSGSPLRSPTAANVETIEVYARQFAWNFRYSGPDHIFGHVGNEFIADAGGNSVGIDPADPAGKDDIVTSSLRIPAGRDIRLLLHSRDVVHDFFVRELRTKQDIVPGMVIPLDIHADQPGQYEIACAELCGLGHNQMHSVLIVMPASEYDEWKLAH